MNIGAVRSIPTMFILNFFTLGIYHYYWIYYITLEVQNFTKRKDISPLLELLLTIITCNLYSIFWYNKYGNIIHKEIALKIDENDRNDVTQAVMVSFIIVLFVGIPIIGGLIFAFVMGVLLRGMSVLYGGAYNSFTLNPEVLLVFAGTILAVIVIILVITAMLLIPDIIMQKKLNTIWTKVKELHNNKNK